MNDSLCSFVTLIGRCFKSQSVARICFG